MVLCDVFYVVSWFYGELVSCSLNGLLMFRCSSVLVLYWCDVSLLVWFWLMLGRFCLSVILFVLSMVGVKLRFGWL